MGMAWRNALGRSQSRSGRFIENGFKNVSVISGLAFPAHHFKTTIFGFIIGVVCFAFRECEPTGAHGKCRQIRHQLRRAVVLVL